MWYAFLGTGLLLSIFTFGSILKGQKSKKWPTTDAIVVSTEVEVKREYDEDGESIYYFPRIHYEFEVDGDKYQSNKYKLLEASMSRRKAEAFISSFTAGQRITIYYDPESPEDAVMKPGEQIYLYFFLAGGIGLAIFSIVKLLL